MKINNFEYKIKTAVENDLYNHLNECNPNFIPPLSNNVDILDYAKKIFEKAITFEYWFNDKLIGCVAAYVNLVENKSFITNVSVIKEFNGLGIAYDLLMKVLEYQIANKIKVISLEVNKNNESAINLYKKLKFVHVLSTNDNLLMELKLI